MRAGSDAGRRIRSHRCTDAGTDTAGGGTCAGRQGHEGRQGWQSGRPPPENGSSRLGSTRDAEPPMGYRSDRVSSLYTLSMFLCTYSNMPKNTVSLQGCAQCASPSNVNQTAGPRTPPHARRRVGGRARGGTNICGPAGQGLGTPTSSCAGYTAHWEAQGAATRTHRDSFTAANLSCFSVLTSRRRFHSTSCAAHIRAHAKHAVTGTPTHHPTLLMTAPDSR
jgi:hypothetical protein